LPSCQNSRPVPAIAVTPLRRADPSQAIERHEEATTRFTVPAYRKFESISLQRRVRCEPISSAGGAERQAAFGINELLTRYSEAERTKRPKPESSIRRVIPLRGRGAFLAYADVMQSVPPPGKRRLHCE